MQHNKKDVECGRFVQVIKNEQLKKNRPRAFENVCRCDYTKVIEMGEKKMRRKGTGKIGKVT